MLRFGIRAIITYVFIIGFCVTTVFAAPVVGARVLHSGFRSDTGVFVLLLDRGTEGGVAPAASYVLSANGKKCGVFKITAALPESAVGALEPFSGAQLPATGDDVALAVVSAQIETGDEPAPTAAGGNVLLNPLLAQGYKVGPGDVLKINAYPSDKLPMSTTVRPDMTINLPYVGVMNVSDMTIFQVAGNIQKRMERDFKQPWVEVSVSEYHSIMVKAFGKLATSSWRASGSGEYPLKEKTRLLEFLISIGGPDKEADPENIKLFRKGAGEQLINFNNIAANPNSDANIYLENGDIIYVPAIEGNRNEVRVIMLGNLSVQGPLSLDVERKGLLEAISQSGGFLPAAALDRVQILRTVEGKTKIDTVNASGIIAGTSPDYTLQTGDLVYVPQRNEKKKTIERINGVLANVLPSLNTMYLVDILRRTK
jgi:protein involved in polysaccharide export with SLBB domain